MGKNKIVEVTWLDTYHVSSNGCTRKDVTKLRPATCFSYAKLIEETDDHITIASNIIEDDGDSDVEQPEYREVTCIPRAVIKSIRELR